MPDTGKPGYLRALLKEELQQLESSNLQVSHYLWSYYAVGLRDSSTNNPLSVRFLDVLSQSSHGGGIVVRIDEKLITVLKDNTELTSLKTPEVCIEFLRLFNEGYFTELDELEELQKGRLQHDQWD